MRTDWIALDEFIDNPDWVIVEFRPFGHQHIARRGAKTTLCGATVQPGTIRDLFSEAYLCARCHPAYLKERA